ncbi:MAG: T9SS type A sorting domain-containing protein [Bacteroidales bacterium]|nr:T9SS type A sorting domain-containing protein [Bacteroidales bacterium]
MRKLLLFSFALSVCSLGFAQNVNSFEAVQKQKATKVVIDQGTFSLNAPINKVKSDIKGPVSSVAVSSSANVYGYLVETQSALTANADINVISFTHRANPAVLGSNSGDIVVSFSKDMGATWNQIMAYPAGAGPYHRYPGGVIHNPTGNTNPDNAYVVTIGPSTDGSNWVSMFSSSNKLDSSAFHRQLIPSYGTLPRKGFQSTSDGKFHVITSNYDATTGNLDTIRLYEGTWDATNEKVDWVCHKLDANFVQDAAGEDFAFTWDFHTAWSNDGTIGYYWTVGRDSSLDVRSYQPIVWKTTNSGATWSKMPIYDFSNLPAITNDLREMLGTTTKRPQFTAALDGVVDANGNLHLIGKIASAFSNNDDSLGFYFSQTFKNGIGFNSIFDVFTTSTGWDAFLIGRVYTVDVDDAETPYGTVGWDLRLQAGKSADETKVFASWTDTDTLFAMTASNNFPMNSFPDLYVVGINTLNGNRTAPLNITQGTGMAGDAYFHYMSDLVFDNSGTYEIPITELDLGNTDTEPVFINYVKGITLASTDFVPNPGIGFEKTVNNQLTVSQNQPNPFSQNTQIQVNLEESANVSLTVYNVAGQKVIENDYGKTAAGNHTLTIDGTSLSSGIYFYTIVAGDAQITQKMVVR